MKEEDLIFTEPFSRAKMGPMEWLQYLADSFLGLAALWDDYSSDDIAERVESCRAKGSEARKIVICQDTANSIDERPLHDLYVESVEMIAEIVDGKNKECLLEAFEQSVVFASMIYLLCIDIAVLTRFKNASRKTGLLLRLL